jgi:hypothetical protein
MGRNEGLPVLHLAESLLDVRPSEEPSAALSLFPMHGRTPVSLGAACMCALADRGQLCFRLSCSEILAPVSVRPMSLP